MEYLIKNQEEKARNFFLKYGKYILSSLLTGILVYLMLMALDLSNDLDGIWHSSNFIAGDWEISLGRGLQRYADRARFGIVSTPFNTILTLLLISISNAFIWKVFEFDSIVYKGLFLILLIANPVICNSLSYSYMSVNFGLAYFFSVAAFCCIKSQTKNRKAFFREVLCGGVLLAFSMAFYQAYICVTCVLIISFLLKNLIEENSVKNILRYIAECLCTIVFGGAIYMVITKLLLYRADIEMAAYKGASDINLFSVLSNLPHSIVECYAQFWNYFYHQKALSNLEFIDIVLAGMLSVYLIAIVIQFVKLLKRNILRAFLFLIMILLLPTASCFILLIAVGNGMSGLMSQGLVMCIVMLGIIVPREKKAGFWISRLHLFILIAFAWFQLSAAVNDQLALKEGKTATITLTENVISQLYNDGYLDTFQTVAFVGRPGNNDSFARGTAYDMANEYAKFGLWSTDSRNNRASWAGVISNYLGTNLSLCGDSEYQEIVALDEVRNMPEFPSEGSIQIINHIIVVKISEVY